MIVLSLINYGPFKTKIAWKIVPYGGMKIVLFDEGSQIEKSSLFDLFDNQHPLRKILSD
jgi:hypothetical protein